MVVAPEPKVTHGGPTPAQIAAAAHAAAAHAAPVNVISPEETGSNEEAVSPELAEAPFVIKSELPADMPHDVTLEVDVTPPAKAPKSRRRASRSAESPAVSVGTDVEPASVQIEPVAVQPVTELPESFQPPTTTESTPVTEVPAPVVRGRRKRARVVAPAGPPRVGEFGS